MSPRPLPNTGHWMARVRIYHAQYKRIILATMRPRRRQKRPADVVKKMIPLVLCWMWWVFSQLTIPWYRSRNSVCPPMKGDCSWARWTKDWFCSIVHSCCNERISWLYKLSLSVRFKKGDCVWARWTEELIHRPLIPEAFFKEMPIAVKTERWKRSPDCRSHFVCLSIRATT